MLIVPLRNRCNAPIRCHKLSAMVNCRGDDQDVETALTRRSIDDQRWNNLGDWLIEGHDGRSGQGIDELRTQLEGFIVGMERQTCEGFA